MFWNKKKKSTGEELVIFFASDLHGSAVCFKKFVNGANFYGANLLVMGGDLTGKAVIPITEQTDGSFKGFHAGAEVAIESQDELDAFIKRVDNQGFYPTVMTEAEFQAMKNDPEAQDTLFRKLVVDRVQEWADYAEEKLKGTDIPLITTPGNDDFFEIDAVLNRAPNIQYHEMEITEFKGHEILHCGGSTKTPWDTEREYTEEEYEARFAELVPQVKDMNRCIFNVHVPPHGTVLDRCPKLDDNLQVVFDMGNPVSMQAGCKALYKVIEEHQPVLGIHGHIHEGRGNIKIGRTVCVNPGSVYPEGILQGVLVTLSGGEVSGVQLTQG
jgi:Icc-related predicted phosphoesterase